MEKKENLYIPMGIKEKNEFWEGFGAEELKGASIFMLISLMLNTVLNLLIGSIFFFIAFIIVSIATSLMIYTKGSTNISVVNQIENMRIFSKSQKKYYYKSLDEWN